MIDLANLMDRISARAAALTGTAGRGVATGDSFAALVRFAADAAPATAQPDLRLVVDNDTGAAPTGPDLTGLGEAADMVPATILAPVAMDHMPASPVAAEKTGAPVPQTALNARTPAPVVADPVAEDAEAGATDSLDPASDDLPASPDDAGAGTGAPSIQPGDIVMANQPAIVAPVPAADASVPDQPVRPARIIRSDPTVDAPAPAASAPDVPARPDRIIRTEPEADSLTAPTTAAPQQPAAPQKPVRPERVLRAGPDTLPVPQSANQPGETATAQVPSTLPPPILSQGGPAPIDETAGEDEPTPIAADMPDTIMGEDDQGRARLQAALAALRVGGRLMTTPTEAASRPADDALPATSITGTGTGTGKADTPDLPVGGATGAPASVSPDATTILGTAVTPGVTPLAAAGGSAAAGNTAQALGDRVIDMGVSGQWIDRMAREITALAQGGGHSRFTLHPPHLGRLDVDVALDGGLANIRMTAETDEAAQRLSDARPVLQADARVGALAIGSFTIEKTHGQSDAARDQNSGNGQQFAGQGQQQNTGGRGQAGGRSAGEQSRGGDWVNRFARDETSRQTGDGTAAPAGAHERGASRVRFA